MEDWTWRDEEYNLSRESECAYKPTKGRSRNGVLRAFTLFFVMLFTVSSLAVGGVLLNNNSTNHTAQARNPGVIVVNITFGTITRTATFTRDRQSTTINVPTATPPSGSTFVHWEHIGQAASTTVGGLGVTIPASSSWNLQLRNITNASWTNGEVWLSTYRAVFSRVSGCTNPIGADGAERVANNRRYRCQNSNWVFQGTATHTCVPPQVLGANGRCQNPPREEPVQPPPTLWIVCPGNGMQVTDISHCPQPCTYPSVSFNMNGGEGYIPEVSGCTEVPLPHAVLIPRREHYDFLGFFDVPATGHGMMFYNAHGQLAVGFGVLQNLSGQRTLHAQWRRSINRVTINMNGGVAGGSFIGWDHQSGDSPPSVAEHQLPRWMTGANIIHARQFQGISHGGRQLINRDGQSVGGMWSITAPTTVDATWSGNIGLLPNAPAGIQGMNSMVPGQNTFHHVTHAPVVASVTAPRIDGFRFDGYYSQPNGGQLVFGTNGGRATTAIITDLNRMPQQIYGRWSGNNIAVNFDMNGGTSVAPGGFNHLNGTMMRSPVAQPVAIPTRPGFIFDGWFWNGIRISDANGNRTIDAPWAFSITGTSVVLQAGWRGVDVTVNMNAGGGTWGNLGITSFRHENNTVPRDGMAFAQNQSPVWNVGVGGHERHLQGFWDVNGIQRLNASGQGVGGNWVIVPATTTTLTARWLGNISLYANLPFGAGNNGLPPNTTNLAWRWTQGTQYFEYSMGLGIAQAVIQAPTLPGFRFDGYFATRAQADGTGEIGRVFEPADASGNSARVQQGPIAVLESMPQQIFARWTPLDRTVTFDLNGGTSTMPMPFTHLNGQMLGRFGTDVITESAPTRPGFSFNGWFWTNPAGTRIQISNSQGLRHDSITSYWVFATDDSNIVLEAEWEGMNVDVTFDPNSPNATDVPYNFTHSNGTILPSSRPIISRPGWHFNGWWTQPSGGTQLFSYNGQRLYNDGWIFPVATPEANLYAQWLPMNFTINLSANGGHFAITGNPITVTGFNIYNAQSLPESVVTVGSPIPVRPGFNFLGFWDTSSSVGGTQFFDRNGDRVFDTAWNINDNANPRMLHARWGIRLELVTNVGSAVGMGEHYPNNFDREINDWGPEFVDHVADTDLNLAGVVQGLNYRRTDRTRIIIGWAGSAVDAANGNADFRTIDHIIAGNLTNEWPFGGYTYDTTYGYTRRLYAVWGNLVPGEHNNATLHVVGGFGIETVRAWNYTHDRDLLTVAYMNDVFRLRAENAQWLNYRFVGWYRNSNFTEGPYTYIGENETGVLQFFARWVPYTW